MLIGPFTQLLTMDAMPPAGPLVDEQLQIIPEGGLRVKDGIITEVGTFKKMYRHGDAVTEITHKSVALPGFVDTHTHICFAGNRAKDYALRVSGVTYQQIAQSGGGIMDTVRQTRKATKQELKDLLHSRMHTLARNGVTTCEVKSGYGLTVEDELKQLEAIKEVSNEQPIDLISTCLAAHTRPPEFTSNAEYLSEILCKLLPLVKEKKLANRIDIFVEEHAFSVDEASAYLLAAAALGFQLAVHADQFTRGGATLAAEVRALSADHLEESTEEDARSLLAAGVIPIVLPGATLGLGQRFPPARMFLDQGLPLVIASDWNPGSAPMGDLLTQAALLGAAQHLSVAETLAAMTTRAATALALTDRGTLKTHQLADINVFHCSDYREILYHQGSLKPAQVFKRGILL